MAPKVLVLLDTVALFHLSLLLAPQQPEAAEVVAAVEQDALQCLKYLELRMDQ
jgi:hypothetical protein